MEKTLLGQVCNEPEFVEELRPLITMRFGTPLSLQIFFMAFPTCQPFNSGIPRSQITRSTGLFLKSCSPSRPDRAVKTVCPCSVRPSLSMLSKSCMSSLGKILSSKSITCGGRRRLWESFCYRQFHSEGRAVPLFAFR